MQKEKGVLLMTGVFQIHWFTAKGGKGLAENETLKIGKKKVGGVPFFSEGGLYYLASGGGRRPSLFQSGKIYFRGRT